MDADDEVMGYVIWEHPAYSGPVFRVVDPREVMVVIPLDQRWRYAKEVTALAQLIGFDKNDTLTPFRYSENFEIPRSWVDA